MESDIRYPSETVANIRTFAKRIKEIAPSVNKISMGPARIPDDVPQSAGLHFSTLISQLFGIANRVSYDSQLAIMPMSLQPDGIRDLVYLSYVTENDDPNISHLGVVTIARQSARTLQHLDISVPQYVDMSELVKNNAVYPCLTQLLLASLPPLPRRVIYANQPKVALSLPTRTHAPLPSVAYGVVLFPSLQSLKITNSYPFADDAPFRGNSRELRKLHLLIDRDVCGILRQYGVFTPTSHPKLHCVKVDMPYDIMPSHFASYDEYVQFALGMGPNAAVRAFEDIHSCLVAPTLSLLQGHDCIQMLALYETRLALADICRIVEWLPLLSDLHCRSIRLGALPRMTFGKFAKYMCSQHISKRQRFRCLRLGYDDGDSIMEIVRCVIGLALAFPAFDYAAVPNYVTAEFMKAIKSTIAMKECKQYAPRLKRLLFTKTG
ncbi:hypothetical protein GGH94_004990 [Coemansia aciculifera]|uniref:Uncharacterized protein n=1 Tax=Coemansia aciculifera TaxID=417176 RepID=A0A9W8IN73_9FUNG|nr:hypothetical protein GGH94_004990 [Coemansia aciculifera]